MSFLNAEWRKLAMANYVIDPNVLTRYVPSRTELDLWEGTCFVSLIGFMFLNTKMLGIKIPFHINFEEVNVHFYVKRFENNTWKRGVVFIKEIVPRVEVVNQKFIYWKKTVSFSILHNNNPATTQIILNIYYFSQLGSYL